MIKKPELSFIVRKKGSPTPKAQYWLRQKLTNMSDHSSKQINVLIAVFTVFQKNGHMKDLLIFASAYQVGIAESIFT